MKTPIIETKRLVLKILDESYAQTVVNYLNRNIDFFKPWTPNWTDDFCTVDSQVKILQDKLKYWAQERELRLHIFKKENTNCVIGDLGFSNIVKGNFLSCHLGYKMDKTEINKGYMTEALIAAIEYLFDEVKLHRIEANVIPGNKNSIRLLEKLGFENEGLSKKYLKVNGVWEDHLHFVLLNENVE